MHMLAIEAFAAIFGQQRRVDVHNLLREGLDQVLWQFPKETSQHNQVNAKVLQLLDKGLAFKILSGDHAQGDAQILCPFDGIGFGIVAHHVGDFNVVVVGKILSNTLQVGAVAADKYG